MRCFQGYWHPQAKHIDWWNEWRPTNSKLFSSGWHEEGRPPNPKCGKLQRAAPEPCIFFFVIGQINLTAQTLNVLIKSIWIPGTPPRISFRFSKEMVSQVGQLPEGTQSQISNFLICRIKEAPEALCGGTGLGLQSQV